MYTFSQRAPCGDCSSKCEKPALVLRSALPPAHPPQPTPKTTDAYKMCFQWRHRLFSVSGPPLHWLRGYLWKTDRSSLMPQLLLSAQWKQSSQGSHKCVVKLHQCLQRYKNVGHCTFEMASLAHFWKSNIQNIVKVNTYMRAKDFHRLSW